MNDSIETAFASPSGTQKPQSQTGSYGSQCSTSMATNLFKQADNLWATYMSISKDTTDEELNEAFRKFAYIYTKGSHYKQLEDGSVDTSGPFTVYAGPDYRLKARRIYHAYGEGSKAMFGLSDAIWDHMSAQLSEHAKSSNSDSLEGFRKVPLTHAILSVPDHIPAPGARPLDFPSEIYRELLGLFTPDKVHRGDPEEKEER
jgi:hypothetical protein